MAVRLRSVLLMVVVGVLASPVRGGPIDVWHWFKRLLDATPVEAHDPPDYSRTLVEALLPEFEQERAAGTTEVGFPELLQVVALVDAGRVGEAIEVVQAPPPMRTQSRDVLRIFMRAKLLLSQPTVTDSERDEAIAGLLDVSRKPSGFRSPRLRFSAVVDALHAAAVPGVAAARRAEVVGVFQEARSDFQSVRAADDAQTLLAAMLWREAFTALTRLASLAPDGGAPATAVPVAWGLVLAPADNAAREAIRAILWPTAARPMPDGVVTTGPDGTVVPGSDGPLQRAARYELVMLDLAKSSALSVGLAVGQAEPLTANESLTAALAQMKRLPDDWQTRILDSGRLSAER